MSTVLVNSNAQITINDQTVETIPVDLTNFGLAASQKSTVVSASFPIAPGPQSTLLPSWVPTSSDYIAFKAAGLVSDITEANSVNLIADATSSNVQLFTSGTPTTVVVTNASDVPAFIALGATNAVAATVAGGT